MTADVEAKCPLRNCGAQLYLVVSAAFVVEDTVSPVSDLRPNRAVTESWDVECEEGHRLDSGSHENDGRAPLLGLRSALSLGGLR